MADRRKLTDRATKVGILLAAFLVLGLSILSRPDWKLRDFDQVKRVGRRAHQDGRLRRDEHTVRDCEGEGQPPYRRWSASDRGGIGVRRKRIRVVTAAVSAAAAAAKVVLIMTTTDPSARIPV